MGRRCSRLSFLRVADCFEAVSLGSPSCTTETLTFVFFFHLDAIPNCYEQLFFFSGVTKSSSYLSRFMATANANAKGGTYYCRKWCLKCFRSLLHKVSQVSIVIFLSARKKEVKKETGLGLTYKKNENFGEWYSEVRTINLPVVLILLTLKHLILHSFFRLLLIVK